MRETTKSIQIGDRTYQINKLSVQDGAWLWFFLSARMKTPDLHDALSAISESEFADLSGKVLAKCFYLSPDTNLPVPVRHVNGTVTDELLADDPTAYFDLVFAGIGFNIAPFLAKAAKEAASSKTEPEPLPVQ
jgi:hypothetical protein